MLSQRDQQVLTRIENQLITGAPDLVALFAEQGDIARARSHPQRWAENLPYRLLVAGLMLLVLGAATMAVSVTVTGISLAMFSLGAHILRRHTGLGRTPR